MSVHSQFEISSTLNDIGGFLNAILRPSTENILTEYNCCSMAVDAIYDSFDRALTQAVEQNNLRMIELTILMAATPTNATINSTV